jgi:hypothetical protein
MLKKLLALCLIAVLLFNLSGYFFIFKYNQHLIRSQVREWIRSGNTSAKQEVLVLEYPLMSGDFKWIDSKEFSYKGKLYDVISCTVSGKSIIFHCINDRDEESLYSRYDTWFASRTAGDLTGKTNNTKAMLYHLIKHALLKESFSFFVPYVISDDRSDRSFPDNCCASPPPSPPPEVSC